jgi:hypothetical protein
MMDMRAFSKVVAVASAALLGGALQGCIVTSARYGAYEPSYVVQGNANYYDYGYTTTAAPGTVYYAGGYYGGVYYRPGYYAPHAPFVTVYGQPQAYARPVARPVYGSQTTYGAGQTVRVQPSGGTAVAQPVR